MYRIPEEGGHPLELRALLAAVENAPPIDAADVLAAELAVIVDARYVSLLIANFSGNAVVRLSHITGGRARRDGHNERAEPITLRNWVYEHVLPRT